MSKPFPIFRQDMTIEEMSNAANRYIDCEWKSLYDFMHKDLTAAFWEIEDAAYGIYLEQLMPTIFGQLESAGFSLNDELEETDFVIAKHLIFRNSMEKWGTEDNRSRVFWNVVRDKRGHALGTLLTEIPHSHIKFDIPSAPVIYPLREVLKEEIVQGIRKLKEYGLNS